MKDLHVHEDEIDEPSLIPETIIKVEIDEKNDNGIAASVNVVASPSPTASLHSESPKLALHPPKNLSPSQQQHQYHRNHHRSSPIVVPNNNTTSSPPMLSPNGSRFYCTTCDIAFNYANTFMAHKKFYCKANKVVIDRPTSNGPSPNAASNVVVSLPAEVL